MLWALSKVFPKTEEISFPSAGFGPEQLTLTEEKPRFRWLQIGQDQNSHYLEECI